MPSFEQFLQALKLKPRNLVAIILFACAGLFIPEEIIKAIGAFDFTQNNRQWFGIALVVASVLLLVECGIEIYGAIRNRARRIKHEKSILQSLHALTEEEKQILRFYIANQSKTNTLRIDDGIVNGLVSKDIICMAASQGSLIEGFAHNINDIAWNYLNKNHGLLVGETKTCRTDKRNYSSW